MNVTLSMLTLRGARFDQPAKFTALERAMAAHDAGFRSIGLEYNDPTMTSDVLDWVSVPELEWVNVDRRVPDDTLDDLIKVILMLQSTRLNAGVGIDTAEPMPLDRVTRNVQALADAVAPYGVTVCMEPIAFGWLPRVADVCKIVRDADRENVALLLDIFQVHADPEWTHASIPADMVGEVQLAGTMREYPRGSHECFMAAMDRPSLVDSAMPIKPWLDNLINDRGYHGPVSVEMPHAINASMGLNMIAANVVNDLAAIA